MSLARLRAFAGSWSGGTVRPAIDAAIAAAILTLVAAVVFGPHVVHGGFWYDDWSNAAEYRFSESPRLWHATETFREILGSRPVLAFGLAAPHAAFGLHTSLHIGLAVSLAVLTSLLLYMLLRSLGVAPPYAIAVGVLALLFPWADSLRLWPSAGINQLAFCLYLGGALLALAALRRSSWPLHAVSLLLYVLAVLTYESVAGVIVLTGVLYPVAAERRDALRRWAVDLGVMLVALAYALATTTKTKGSITARLDAVPEFAKQTIELVSISVLPLGNSREVKAAGGLLVLGLVILLVRRWRRGELGPLRPWAAASVLALAVIAVTYAFFLGRSQQPLAGGGLNRGNIFAAPAYAVIVILAASLVATLVAPRLRAGVVVGVLVAAVAVAYAVQSRQDANLWDRGADEQQKVLAAVRHAAFGVQARPLTVYSFGAPASISESIPVFSTTYDLDGAARATLDDPSLHAYPVWGDVRLTCGASRVVPAGRRHFDASISAPYGRAVLVDVPTGRTARPIDRAACRRALESFVAGERLASD